MFSTCDSVSPSGSEENSHVKAKATPSGTKFVQFNISHNMAQAHGRLGSLIKEASDEDDDVVSVSSNEVTIADNPVIVAETEFQQEPQSSSSLLLTSTCNNIKNDHDPLHPCETRNSSSLASFCSSSTAVAVLPICGFGYNIKSASVANTPRQARLEDCDVNTPRGEFIQHNCTPKGTVFVQLNTESAQNVGKVLSDLTEMESKWEGKLDSKAKIFAF